MIEVAATPKKTRNTRSWKTEARRHEAEATFYRTQAEQAAANFKARRWWAAGWAGVAFLLGLALGWWVRG